MKDVRRIVIVSELFYPEESATAHIMTRIAEHLGRNNDVLVIAGPESYEGEKQRISSHNLDTSNLVVKRVWGPKLNKNKLAHRAARLMLLSISLAWMALTRTKSRDILFSVTNPAPLVVFLALIKKLKSIPYVLLVHDVFPENAVATGVIRDNTILYKLTKLLFDWAYGTADTIITIGRDMAELVGTKARTKNNEKIKIIENWSELSLINPVLRLNSRIPLLGLEKKVVIEYAGNIGRAQGFLELIEVIKLVDNQSIHFLFAGSGALRASLEKQLSDINNVSILDAYSRKEQSIILGSCDIALVVLGRGMYGLGVPSKAYNIMAAGKPILFVGPRDSEIFRLVKDNDIGWSFDWDEHNQLIGFINSIKQFDLPVIEKIGIKARQVAERLYNEKIAMEKFSKVITSLV